MPATPPPSPSSLASAALATLLALALALALAAAPAAAQRRDSTARVPELPPADSLVRRVPADQADPARGVRLCAGGDVTLGTNLPTFVLRDSVRVPPLRTGASRAERRARAAALARARNPRVDTVRSSWTAEPASLLAPLRPLVRDADLVLLNIEGAIGEGRTASKCGPRSTMCYAFRMPPSAAPALRALRDSATVVGNVANNHSRDAGTAGFDSTVAHLARAGVVTTGADTLATPAVTLAGDTVAFLGFATSGPGTPDVRDLEAVRRHVRRAAARWPRLVVTMHIGGEGLAAQRTRDTTEFLGGGSRGNPVAFARAVVESGADLVIGHGPHVMRAGEWRGDVPVFYSLGNLVTYGPFSNRTPIDRGAVLCATLDADGRAGDLLLRSTRQRTPGDLVPDESGRAAALVDSLSRLDFPATGVHVGGDGRVLPRVERVSRRRPVRPPA